MRWLAVVLGLSTGACSFLIDAPDARYAATTDAGPPFDADMDAADAANDAETIEDADALGDSSAPDAQSCTSHAQCETPIEACRMGAFCNQSATCEDTIANDCTPCGEPAAVCVKGTCRPEGEIYAFDFEGAALGDEWSGSPTRLWTLTSEHHHDGSQAAGSPMRDSSFGSDLELSLHDVPFDAVITFWFRVSSQMGRDRFEFHVRNSATSFEESVLLMAWGGHQDWKSFTVDPRAMGDVTFTWRFVSMGADSASGENRAFIDDVSIKRRCD